MDITSKTAKHSVTFYLDKTKGQIFLFLSFDRNRVKIYTKENLKPDLWNADKQRAKETIKNPGYAKTNKNLNEMENTISKLFDKFIQDYSRKPEPAEIRDIFNKEYFDKIPQFAIKRPKTFLETFDEYIESKRIENTESTAKKYEQAKQNLIDFGKKHKQQIQFENINMDFRNKFVKYLQTELKYAPSTIYRKLKFVKTVLLYGLDSGYINKLNINLSKFLTKDRPGNQIALSELELNEIENLDLSQNKRLEQVRDKFLIGCYTGLRFSDFIRLNKNHIQDGKYIIINQQKVKSNVTIPFFDEVKQIFEKYEYNLPKPISEPKFNEYLKEVTQQCDTLKRLQETTQFVGNIEKKVNVPRHSLVTSHTARRTFVTLNHAKGIDLETLTTATGHTTVKALKTYVKLDDKQKADILNKAFEIAKQKENIKTKESKSAKIIKMNAL